MAIIIDPLDSFISKLYRSTQQIDLGYYRHWALNELQDLLDFDAAVWSTGHVSTRTFHTHTTIGLGNDFPEKLLHELPLNPISKVLFFNPGEAIDMTQAIPDKIFYKSEVYYKVFKEYGIERILSSIHIDKRSGIYTLLSIYRRDRDHRFSQTEKSDYQRALFHLLQAASQACMAGLHTIKHEEANSAPHVRASHYSAICDAHGIYHEVEQGFLDMIEEAIPNHAPQQLPFPLSLDKEARAIGTLHIESIPLGDLFRVSIRPSSPIDQLTKREKEVVQGVTKGLSFKQIAKKLDLSPSTVSNHLYRVYQKLNINNRSELADLIRQ